MGVYQSLAQIVLEERANGFTSSQESIASLLLIILIFILSLTFLLIYIQLYHFSLYFALISCFTNRIFFLVNGNIVDVIIDQSSCHFC